MAVEKITTPSSAAESFFIIPPISHAIVVNGDFACSTCKFASIGHPDAAATLRSRPMLARPVLDERVPSIVLEGLADVVFGFEKQFIASEGRNGR
jgi:hypothetical protein